MDAVIISTADFQHARHTVHAVKAGKDTYSEKPMAEDMEAANGARLSGGRAYFATT